MHSVQALSKAQLRRAVLARRDATSIEWRIEASLAAAEHGLRAIPVEPDEVVSGFWPIRSEIDIRPLLAGFRETGARLCLPVVLDGCRIAFRELERGAKMVDTGFGTIGPGEEAGILRPTLMLVPLAAFDGRGHRIGYGAGHYDRAIAEFVASGPRPRLIGVGFDLQEIEAVPAEDHDECLDAVLTESGLRSCSTQL